VALRSYLRRCDYTADDLVNGEGRCLVSPPSPEHGARQCRCIRQYQPRYADMGRQITHVQFLTLLYPSRTEARLILCVLGKKVFCYQITSLTPRRTPRHHFLRPRLRRHVRLPEDPGRR